MITILPNIIIAFSYVMSDCYKEILTFISLFWILKLILFRLFQMYKLTVKNKKV